MPAVPNVIGNYYLYDKLGSGFSGTIYRASHLHTGHVVALKVQDVHHECPTNAYERYIYAILRGGFGVPTLWAAGVQGAWDYLAIDLLGPSLDSLFSRSGLECMDVGSVCCIARQVISRLELIHSKGILHRDIQLGNCVLGLPGTAVESTIYMIDFGFAKQYIDPTTKRHIADSKTQRHFVGNYWFSSAGVHCRGRVPSRRDDLESVALMLIHLLTPRGLVWTRRGVPKTASAHALLELEKVNARPEDLCRGLPAEFEEFLRYCRRLKFAECPDYRRWREAFRDLAVERGFRGGAGFVWPPAAAVVERTPRKTLNAISVEKLLLGLAGLEIADPVKKAPEVISISSSEASIVRRNIPKAEKLRSLTDAVGEAGTNAALSELIATFAIVLRQTNSSRLLTKDGSAFLDAVCGKLVEGKRASGERVGMARLRKDVVNADRWQLGRMVAEFVEVSRGRRVSKEGFAFLEGLSKRLNLV